MGNGDEASGDGWRYRGRGFIDPTGKAAYARLSGELGIDLVGDPDMMLDFTVAAEAAAIFWDENGCNGLADKGDIAGITHVVNGSLASLAKRQMRLEAARRIFTPGAMGIGGAPVSAQPKVDLERMLMAPARPPLAVEDGPPIPPTPAPPPYPGDVYKTAPRPTPAPSTISAGAGIASATVASGVAALAHIDLAKLVGLVLEIAAVALVPVAFYFALEGLSLLHVHRQAKVRSELLAILARGSAVARQSGAVANEEIARMAADYTIKGAPALIRELGLATAAAPETLTNMALALLPAPNPGDHQ